MLANIPRIVVALSLLLSLIGTATAQMVDGESCTNTLTQAPHTHSDGCEETETVTATAVTVTATAAVPGSTITVQGPTYAVYTSAETRTVLVTLPTATEYTTIAETVTFTSEVPRVETVTVPVAHTITTQEILTIETTLGSPTPTATVKTVITSLETIVTEIPSTVVTTVVPSATTLFNTVPIVETITTLETITELTTLGSPTPTATVLTTLTTLATITTTIPAYETIITNETLTLFITLGTPTPTQTLTTTITNLVTLTVPAPTVQTITSLETITAYTTLGSPTPTLTVLTTYTSTETFTTIVPVVETVTTLETITLLLTLGSPTPTLTTATTITTLVTLAVHATPASQANSTVPLNFQSVPKDYGTVPVPTPVQNASAEYIRLFGDAFLYYEAERSGHLPSDNRISWRNDSALTDGSDNNIDLVGGYYDAGGYLKFTFPLSFTLSIISWGSVEYLEAYVTANQTDYLRAMVKWGTDWLIKAHASVDTLYVQVGNVTLDESYSGPDTSIPTPRPSYFINSTYTGTDVAAEAAAAFASASVLFSALGSTTKNSNDTAYAATLLIHAEQLFDFAINAKPYNLYQTSDTALSGKYTSTGYTDELFWASVHLYRATKNVTYLDTARTFYTSFNLSGSTRAVNWDWKTGAAYVLIAELTYGDVVTGLQATNDSDTWRGVAEQFLDSITNITAQGAYLTQGGLLWYNGTSEGNSLSVSMTQSMLLYIYSSSVLRRISGSSQQGPAAIRAARYETFAQTQVDYVLGLNPSEVMFIAGERPNSPQSVHSSLVGGEITSSNATSNVTLPPKTLFILKGALVSGPNSVDSFDDSSADTSETLVGLHYNAPLQVLIARQIIYSPKNPFYIAVTNSSTPAAGAAAASSNNSFPAWAIALIVILLVLFLLALLLCLCCFRRRRAAAAGASTDRAAMGTTAFAAGGPDRAAAVARPEMSEVVVADDTVLTNTAPAGTFEVDEVELEEAEEVDETPVMLRSNEAPTNESGFKVESEDLEEAGIIGLASTAPKGKFSVQKTELLENQAPETKKKGWFGRKKPAVEEVHGFPVESQALTAGSVGVEAETEELDINETEINGPAADIAIAGAATATAALAAKAGINRKAAAATGALGDAAKVEKVEIDEVDTITTRNIGRAGAAAAGVGALAGRARGAAGGKEEVEIDETDIITTRKEVESNGAAAGAGALAGSARRGFGFGFGAKKDAGAEVEVDETDVITTRKEVESNGAAAGAGTARRGFGFGFGAKKDAGAEIEVDETDVITTKKEIDLGAGANKRFGFGKRGAGAEEVEVDEVDVTTTKIGELNGNGNGVAAGLLARGAAAANKGYSATRAAGETDEIVTTEVDEVSPKGKLTRTKTETETVSDGNGKITRTTTTYTTTTSKK